MSTSRYVENQILSADPMGLVRLLYQGAIDSLLQAASFFSEGKIQERSAAISKAMQIVVELQTSLNMDAGGEIAQRLAQLYAYIQERLVEANAEQKMPPLQEAIKLLNILYGGWEEAALQVITPVLLEPTLAVQPAAGWTG